ncbi:MAG: hypothetical protein LC646_08575 [Xanthomonadaceae bacterium]|nr:hypothetical protein [Xanthomonadaceae bacterium]
MSRPGFSSWIRSPISATLDGAIGRNPAVTCAIPATSKVEHLRENMGAGYGRLPDARMRQRMSEHFARL